MTMPGGGAAGGHDPRSTGGPSFEETRKQQGTGTGERAQQGTDPLRQTAEQGAETAQGEARDQAERARESAEGFKDEAKERALHLMEEAKTRVRSAVDQRKQGVAEEFADVAHALRAGARDLEERHNELLARYISQAASGLERAADHVRQQDFTSLLHETEAFARRQPGLFFGGVFALGFALSRFVKSSAERHHEEQRASYTRGTPATDMPTSGSTYPPRPAGEASAATAGAARASATGAGPTAAGIC